MTISNCLTPLDLLIRKLHKSQHWWLMPVILVTQEAEIRRIVVQSQPKQIVLETLPQKNPSQQRAGGVAQGVDTAFKPQYLKKKKKERKERNLYKIL
jgi:hypothetical protein